MDIGAIGTDESLCNSYLNEEHRNEQSFSI